MQPLNIAVAMSSRRDASYLAGGSGDGGIQLQSDDEALVLRQWACWLRQGGGGLYVALDLKLCDFGFFVYWAYFYVIFVFVFDHFL